MANPLLQHYIKLTEFLGQALGPDYEVALHDMTDKNRSIVAIANNHISGREIGAPLTNVALKILMDKSYETQDYRLHYCGLSAEGQDAALEHNVHQAQQQAGRHAVHQL